MKWFLDLLPRTAAAVANDADDELLVELNDRGGWSLRFAGEAPAARIGNYPSPEAAARIGRMNVARVRVIDPAAAPSLTP